MKLRRLRALLETRKRRRKETMKVLANNREVEASLWARIAHEKPAGPEKNKALARHGERTREVRRLRGEEASLLRSLGIKLGDE